MTKGRKTILNPIPLRVFLCHASEDKPEVVRLYDRLHADGIEPWLDNKGLLPGEDWEDEITDAIRNSDLIIICLTQESIRKEGFFQKEIRIALEINREKPEGTIFIIPARLQECEIPRNLRRLHIVSLFEDKGYEQLMLSLGRRAHQLLKNEHQGFSGSQTGPQTPSRSRKRQKGKDQYLSEDVRVPPRIYRPGGAIPIDAANYITRDADAEVAEALSDLPVTMLVSGPVQCGKSSLIARLEYNARVAGVETAWFDPRIPLPESVVSTDQQLDINGTVARALGESLQVQWGLEQPGNGAIDSVPKLLNWLSKELALSISKPRLLILDDLASLGADAVEHWVLLFVRALNNKRATGGPQVSICVGLTHPFASHFRRSQLSVSSMVHWWPKIELGWLNRAEVGQLRRSIKAVPPEDDDLFDLYAGQPYLTHAAIMDTGFRDCMRHWLRDPSEVSSKTLRGSQIYRRHLSAIRRAVLGPTMDITSEARYLFHTFAEACSGQVSFNTDHRLFLQASKLLDTADQPTLPIYQPMVEDLLESIER